MPKKSKEELENIEVKYNIKKTTTKKKTTTTTKTTTKAKTTKKADIPKATSTKKTSTVKKAPTTKKTSATKKASTAKKTSTTKNKTTKKTTKQKITTNIVEYYDLPQKYNKTIVKILAQTPKTLFIYWEISDDDIEKFKKDYGENFFEATKPVLIVHNDTLNYSFEVEINDFANSWY